MGPLLELILAHSEVEEVGQIGSRTAPGRVCQLGLAACQQPDASWPWAASSIWKEIFATVVSKSCDSAEAKAKGSRIFPCVPKPHPVQRAPPDSQEQPQKVLGHSLAGRCRLTQAPV